MLWQMRDYKFPIIGTFFLDFIWKLLYNVYMRIISRKIIDKFIRKHPDSKSSINSWYYEVKNLDWNCPADIKARYPSVSIITEKLLIFNIKGNSYRMAVKISYESKIVFIKWLGTHSEYDKKKFN